MPLELEEGIYACRVHDDGESMPAVMHFGPRPVFKDTPSCEVHLLGKAMRDPPELLSIEIVERLREVRDFPSVSSLKQQIAKDIEQAHAVLSPQ